MTDKTDKKIEAEVTREVTNIFEDRKRKLGVDASLDLKITRSVWGAPIVGGNVYGEAFPFEKPPRVWIEVFVPDATKKEIIKTLCHELIHIQYPKLKEDSEGFKKKVQTCIRK